MIPEGPNMGRLKGWKTTCSQPHYLHFLGSVIPTPCLVNKKDFFFSFLCILICLRFRFSYISMWVSQPSTYTTKILQFLCVLICLKPLNLRQIKMQRNCRIFVVYVEGCGTLVEIYASIEDSTLNIMRNLMQKVPLLLLKWIIIVYHIFRPSKDQCWVVLTQWLGSQTSFHIENKLFSFWVKTKLKIDFKVFTNVKTN